MRSDGFAVDGAIALDLGTTAEARTSRPTCAFTLSGCDRTQRLSGKVRIGAFPIGAQPVRFTGVGMSEGNRGFPATRR